MSDRRRDAATATVGAVGVGGAAALRHEALVRAHNERATPWSKPENRRVERKRVFAERRLLKTPKGRGTYLAGAGLGLVALPALATGTNNLIHTSKRDSEHRGFFSEGLAGARAAAIDRSDTVREGAPKKLVAGNYAAGVGVGAGAGSLTHAALRKTKVPLHGRSAIAAITAGVTGTAALPVQSKLTARYSRGKYEVTPTGVRRVKTRAKRASSKATVVDARSMDPRAFRAQTVGKAAWKAFHPAPPMRGGGVRKIPSSQLTYGRKLNKLVATDRRGREVGWIKAGVGSSSNEIGGVLVAPGFRRRGVATRLLEEARRRQPVEHSVDRTVAGNKWAKAVEARRGGALPTSERDASLAAARKNKTLSATGLKRAQTSASTEKVRGYRVRASGGEGARTYHGARANKARPVGRVGKSFIPGKGYLSASEAGVEALRAAAAPKSGGPGVTLTARQSYLRGRKANRKSMIEVSANHKQKRQQKRIDRGRQVSPLNRWAGDLERRTKPELDPWRSDRKLTSRGYVSTPRWRLPVSGESISDAKARQIQNWRVSKMSPRELPALAGAHWTTRTTMAADRLEAGAGKSGRLVATGKTRAARSLRKVAHDTSAVPTMLSRQIAHPHMLFGKREDPGASMSRGERRARIAASGPPIPIVGDIIQARQAARLSPEKYATRTAVQTTAAGQAGGYAGNAAGAGLALGAARLSPGFDRRAKATNDKIDEVTSSLKSRAYRAAGREQGAKGPGLTRRALDHPRTPQVARSAAAKVIGSRVGRAAMANPKVAAVGALAGGMVAGPAAQQAMLSHTMSRDDRYRRSLAKRQADKSKPIPLSQREQHVLRRRKERSAVLSVAGGTTGLGALGATVAGGVMSRRPGLAQKIPKTYKLVHDVQVPLLTAGAGIGGVNAFTNAAVQHKEAKQIRKSAGHLPPKGHLVLMSGDWSVAMNRAAREHPRRRIVLDRIEHMRRRNRKAIPQQRSTRVGEDGYYEYMPGGRVSKALRIPGVRRAPGMRRATLRQTRYPSGVIRTSTVRGGLA